jgi:hypothetical protein
MEVVRNVYKTVVDIHEKSHLKESLRWEYNIKIDLEEIGLFRYGLDLPCSGQGTAVGKSCIPQ